MAVILVVDDDENICSAFSHFLAEEGHTALIASNAQDALRAVETSRPKLVIMDVRLPGIDGLEALERIRQVAPDVYVVIMTAYGTSRTSIEAARLGAYEYLTKPFDLDVMRSVIDKALRTQALGREAPVDSAEQRAERLPVDLVGKSPQMEHAYKLIGLVTTNDVPVLIVGERGTGKKLAAKTIHSNSRRRDKAFVAVDCGALPPDMLAEEIFGRYAGDVRAAGNAPSAAKIEHAEGGTLFLDDIDATPLPLQARLVRLLTDRAFQRNGGLDTIRADVRLIAATTEDLADEAREGSFNADLHDALRLITISLPPLRERLEDIPELVTHFTARSNAELGKAIKRVDPRVMQLFADYPWPGNVGELEHALKRACVLARGEVITPEDLGDSLQDRPLQGREETENTLESAIQKALQQRLADKETRIAWPPFHQIVRRAEKILISEALTLTSGNQVKAAQLLGLNRATLRKKMRLYRLPEK